MTLADKLHLPTGTAHAPHDPARPVLEVTDLCVRYQGREALSSVTFKLKAGERVAVVGPNGAGKSTLFKVIAGLVEPASGDVRVYGHRPAGHTCIAYVPQRSQVDWTFPVTVLDVVLMGRSGTLGLFRRAGRSDREHVRGLLDVVGIANLADRQISELSGGQQQRMFIARALAMQAELMLMDEPFSGLDGPSQDGLLSIIETLGQRHVTVLVALHDLNLAMDHFDRALLLNHSLIGFGKPQDVFTTDRLASVYGVPKLRSIPVDDACCSGGGHSHG